MTTPTSKTPRKSPGNLKQGSLFSFFAKKPAGSTPASSSKKKTTIKAQPPAKPSTGIPSSSATPSKTSTNTSISSSSKNSAAATKNPTTTTTRTITNTNTQWKKVSVGDSLRIWWADDGQYYAARVVKHRSGGSSFFVEYDDGESEWIDLATEKFQFLSRAGANQRKRRRIDDDEDDDEEEHEWNDDDDEEHDEEDDDGSVFVANDDDKDQDDEDEDEDDQWMVTDDEDDREIATRKPPTKKAKKASIRVTEHKAPTSLESPPKPSPQTSTAYATPLRQFANTVSPSTNSTAKSRRPSPASTAAPSPAGLAPPSASSSSPRASHHSGPPKALPYTKGAVNIQGAHVHNHLNFLRNPRDRTGKRKGEAGYNPRTLRVVEADWKAHVGNMTNAVRQWWDLKAQYFDSVLLFKTGKFYEMFHMDADVGVKVLGLSYMKGHVAHAGFPEISYGPMADKLVRAGCKVARVEQTETPDQLKIRKQKTTRGKKPSVVNREVCSIVSLGTRVFCALDDPRVLSSLDAPDGAGTTGGPLLAIREQELEVPDSTTDPDAVRAVCEYGITIVDAVRAEVTLGQFADDVLRSRMNTLLARTQPSEILLEETASPTLVAMVKAFQSTSATTRRIEVVRATEDFPSSTALDATHREGLERGRGVVRPWDPSDTRAELHRRAYYPRASKNSNAERSEARWPPVLRAVVDGGAALCLSSFGAALYHLQRHLVDREILGMGIVRAYVPEASLVAGGETAPTFPAEAEGGTGDSGALAGLPVLATAEDRVSCLSLDGTTLHNLEILTNSVDHKPKGSLWSKINHCKSPHGARFLRAWLLRPLFRKADIDRRADAVEELASGAAAVSLREARQDVLSKTGDLDRLLSRIHAMSGAAGDDAGCHPSERAVLYESATYTKRKVNDFSKALGGLRKACRIPELFRDLPLAKDGLLSKLVTLAADGGGFPDMEEELDWFTEHFDCQKAAKGLFEPSRGVDAAYDEACDTLERIRSDLEDYRTEMCGLLSPRHVARAQWKYINTKPESKDKYLIELPASVEVPDDFLVKGKRGSGHKQVNKYRTPVVARLVQELERALECQQTRKAKGMQLIFARFDSKRSLWKAAAQATAMLDALGSLAVVAAKPGFCRPTILDCPPDAEPFVDIVQGRHPCVESSSSIHSTEFIPNDLRLGGTEGDAARLLLLSGPNMGGKSTLLRQTCLIAILAQLGSYVPAEACSLTPIDCIYTRLGASDRILLGQSTFFVELAETAAALRGATRRSLVIMDELGRGTSTFDGTAIAGATVKHLIERSQCLSLFATHYHSLLDEWKNEPKVRLGHMQCLVDDSTTKDGVDADHSITFLYTLGPGTCPKSFGINVARLASLPSEVLSNAKRVSEEFEEEMAGAQTAGEKERIMNAIESGDWDELKRLWDTLKQ